MATQRELLNAIKAAESAGDIRGARILAHELAKLRPPKSQPPSIGERYMSGLKAGAERGYLGVKGLVTDLSPEELSSAEQDKQSIQAGGIPAALGEATVELPAYLAAAAVPAAGIPAALGRIGLSGLIGAALSPTDRAKAGMMTGAGAVAGEAIPYAMGAVGRIMDPFSKGGQERILSRTLNRVAGDKAGEIADRLTSAKELVPGSMPTAAEAAQPSGGLAALQRWAEQADPEEYAYRRLTQSDARKAALEGIAGTEAQKAAALAERESVTGPLYEAAKGELIPVDDAFRSLLTRPSVSKAFREAAKISAERGDPISRDMVSQIMEGANQGYISGEGLHWLKIGLDSLRSKSQTTAGREMQRALGDTISEFEAWREKNIPTYATAQQTYRQMSKPVSQQQIGQAMLDKLQPALAEYGPLTSERAASYAQALRSGDQLAQSATGFKGARLADIMTPEQMTTFESLAQDLSRRAAADMSGRGVGSNTFQNLAMQNLTERAGSPAKLLGTVGRAPIISYGIDRAEQEMKSRLAAALLDPAEAARLMKMKSGPLAKLFSQSAQPYYGAAGASLITGY
jgi:hypothetical protein